MALDFIRRSFAAFAAGLALLAAFATAASASPPRAIAGTLWTDEAKALIEQLDRDILTSVTAGADVPTARIVLSNTSDKVAMLIAAVDFGSCHESVRSLGVPAKRFRHVATELASACTLLERASMLFTRATTNSDPRALVDSAQLSRKAGLLVTAATSELQGARP
jgi:hypothetical protein